MDIETYVGQLEQMLAEAKSMPLSSSVMINRTEFDEVLNDLREHIPEELRQSRWIIKERDEVLAAAAREADEIRAEASEEQERLISETEVVRAARREADHVLEEAREQSRVLRLEAEDYVDSKLASFEIVLNKTLASVEKGRERLRGRYAADELAPGELPRSPLDDVTSGDLAPQLYDHERR